MMGRYLMYFAYVGTKYSGLQIQNVANLQRKNIKTIAGVIQNCINYLRPRDKVKVITSSRTDQGVHAFTNTAHIDILRKYGQEYTPSILQEQLNKLLYMLKEDIRILKVIRVNDDFHCRYDAKARSYMYRLAVLKCQLDEFDFSSFALPQVEVNRCHTVLQPFDTEKFLKSAEIISGIHDFTAFTVESYRSGISHPIRNMTVGIKRGQIIHNEELSFSKDMYDVWEIHLKCNSFLYKQVRRMIGCMYSVACGKVQLDDLKHLLKDPSYLKVIGDNAMTSLKSHGLYLKKVYYNPTDLIYQPHRDVDYELFVDEVYVDYTNQLYNISTDSTHVSTKPRHLSTKPRHLSTNPRHLSTDSTHLSTNPRHLSTDSTHLSTNPRHLSRKSSHMPTKSSHVPTEPNHLSTKPNHLSTKRSHVSTESSHLSTKPSNLST